MILAWLRMDKQVGKGAWGSAGTWPGTRVSVALFPVMGYPSAQRAPKEPAQRLQAQVLCWEHLSHFKITLVYSLGVYA